MKKLNLIKNFAKGMDLELEKDTGNPILILTGKPSLSRKFYKQLQKTCEIALIALKGVKDN